MTKPVASVCRPARMMAFGSVEAFRPHANNFYLMFVVMGEPIPDVYRHRPAFRRFTQRYPERVTELEVILEAEGRVPGELSSHFILA